MDFLDNHVEVGEKWKHLLLISLFSLQIPTFPLTNSKIIQSKNLIGRNIDPNNIYDVGEKWKTVCKFSSIHPREFSSNINGFKVSVGF